ncbi:DMT family transporter [Mesorhizobium sp. ES1-1]|uniref:DMT family transporter n=1 Tax=Mesorhizobium sp. ES1-1 TaxID=2876629 RepID=UPI001CCB2FF1|nr:EamA family transporter [Mesorhizobium sp. ES1-1]MBZ9678538.1 EamA family transporter [Mesorhizobium sp. ES1-1]
MTQYRNLISFLALCVIWGSTWIAIKAGISAVPPLLFAGTRFTAAGAILLLASSFIAPLPRVAAGELARLGIVSMLMIPLCYGPLFWGMLYVNSGTAAVLEMSLTPIALLGFALVLRQEPYSWHRLLGIFLGVAGLVILFGPDAFGASAQHATGDPALQLLGGMCVASAAITYAWGSVLAKPLLSKFPSNFIAGTTMLAGGLVLIASSLLLESGAGEALAGRWGAAAWSGWLFLVLFGSLIGYTLYMRLLREIGASRAGAYAFVSPIVALLLGVVIGNETVSAPAIAGMAVMLAGAYLATKGKDVVSHDSVQTADHG